MLDVCDMARRHGTNIYFPKTQDGSGSIGKAIEFLVPHIGKPEAWPYQQIHDWDGAERLLIQCIYRAASYDPDSNFREIYNANAHKLPGGMFSLVNM
jgi:hypothetical protein